MLALARPSVNEVWPLAATQTHPFNRPANDNNITSGLCTRTKYTYAGLFAQTSTGLLLSTTRAYDPANGKWLNVDPIREASGINLTGYVGARPMAAIDPLGLEGNFFDDTLFPAIEDGVDIVGEKVGQILWYLKKSENLKRLFDALFAGGKRSNDAKKFALDTMMNCPIPKIDACLKLLESATEGEIANIRKVIEAGGELSPVYDPKPPGMPKPPMPPAPIPDPIPPKRLDPNPPLHVPGVGFPSQTMPPPGSSWR